MLQLLILLGRALALGLRGHRELVLEPGAPAAADRAAAHERSPATARV
jgi:hypothetical protein